MLVAIIFFFFILSVRLLFVQVVDGAKYSVRAAEQWYRDLPLSPKRGVIYDKNGQIIADNETVYSVYIRPAAVENVDVISRCMQEYLNVDGDKIAEKIKDRKVSEITVKKGVEEDVGKKLMAMNLPGVYFSVEYKRSYAKPEHLAQVIGFTNVDGKGQNGLEGYYDKYVSGTLGYSLVQADNRGQEIDEGKRYYVPPIPGSDVYCTIDMTIQAFCEEATQSALEEWRAKSATMLVMEAKTGAIIAMSQKPSYRLDDLPRNDVEKLNSFSKNKMIVDVYEPGSTFKIFTTALALERGVVTSDSCFFCPGYRVVDGQRIRCWRSIGHGSVDLVAGVQNSCNCVFMDLALRIGKEGMYDGLSKFGFGKKTGVDFFGESAGLMMNVDNVKNVDLARIGFGQAIAMTPLQLASGVCEVVNGGYSIKPHFVDRIISANGDLAYEFTSEKERLIGESTSKTMRMLLENVVKNGSGRKANVEGYRVGGKTGTAQKYGVGGVAQGKYVSSFVGFAPADDPKYVVLMTVDEPTAGAYYGSIVAAPYVGRVFSKIFDYEKIPPSLIVDGKEEITMPDLEGMTVQEALAVAKKYGLYCECDGEGEFVISTLPIEGEPIRKGSVILIKTG